MPATFAHQTVTWLGTSYRVLLAPEKPKETLSMFESVSPPGSGPPRHVHSREDETFYILSGDVDFWLAGEIFSLGPGEVAHVPRGREHTFRVAGKLPARMLTILSPGGFERFFAEMAANGYAMPEHADAIAAVAARYGLAFTGPPLGEP